MAPISMSIGAVGDVVLDEEHARRRAALAGAVEGGAHGIAHDLLGQRGGIGDHGVEAAGLGDERHDGAAPVGQRLLDGPAVSLEPVKATPSMRVSLTSAAPTAPPPGSRCRALGGTPASCSSCVGEEGGDRRLFGGLGETALPAASAAAIWPVKMASGKFHGEMQAKAPRPLQRQLLVSPVGPGSSTGPANRRRASHGVVAQEVDGLAHLGQRVVQRLAGLAHDQGHQARAVALEQVGGALEHARARRRRPACPSHAPARTARFDGGVGLRRRRDADGADALAPVVRTGDEAGGVAARAWRRRR